MHRRQAPWARTLVALALLFCAACASMAGDVDGVEWRLASWTLSSLPAADTGITATFAEGEVSGFAGVNSYGAECRLGPDGSLELGPIRSTKRGGPEPAMRAEGAFTTLLGQARSWKLRGDTLVLYDAAGHESLSFSRAPEAGAAQ